MKISMKWLSDYTDSGLAVDELAPLLTSLGLEVEGIDTVGETFSGVITGRVEQVQPHPDADSLQICFVSDGKNSHNIVCGAPNVRPGIIAPLACPGAKLPGGTVRKAKIRGAQSDGMLVSKRELGIIDDHSGIFELPKNTPLGMDLVQALDLQDTVIESAVTPNRPDCLSMIGVAREVAAGTKKELTRPKLSFEPVGGTIDELASVSIEDSDLCARYTGILVKNITVGPSPNWMARRLEAAGVRSINNIVDITNFVNLECGQPLHAFDYDFLSGHKIIVRRAKPGEKIVTLDEQTRKLDDDSLLICDGEKPIALAGIMGGQNSLVTDTTRDVFIESAYFDPTNIRRTSRIVGLASESSYRFERGVDVDGVPWGLHRAAHLMVELCGGELVPGFIDEYPRKIEPPTIALRTSRVNHLLGTELDDQTISKLLSSIELSVEGKGENLKVIPPTFRVDLEREVDLIEEVARLYGFDNVKPTFPVTEGVTPSLPPMRELELVAREALRSAGMCETITFAFTRAALLDLFRDEPGRYVKMANPLSEDFSVLRDTLFVGLCQNLSNNLRRQAKSVRLFEVRRIYLANKSEKKQPKEKLYAGGVFCGRGDSESWANRERQTDFFDMKGAVESLLARLQLDQEPSWHAKDDPAFVPGTGAEIQVGGRCVGRAGQLCDGAAKAFDIDMAAYLFEVDLSGLIDKTFKMPEYLAPSRYPMTTRDIAIVTDRAVDAAALKDTIERAAPKLIREVVLFDVYTKEKVKANEKSLAFSIKMQKSDSEVSEKEAEKVVQKALAALISRHNAKLRE
jgi:phenylalanyl-tRNA synthetase beta chain